MYSLLRGERRPVAKAVPLERVTRVEFYKIDELTTDLICCQISLGGSETLLLHEEMVGWEDQIERLAGLKDFDQNWFAKVAQPPFAPCNHVAFERTP